VRRATAYASGNLGKAVLVGALELTAIYYFTDLIGAPPSLVGAAMFATHLWTAVTDLVVGRTLDRLNLAPRRAGPFIILGAGLALVTFIFLYALPFLHLRYFWLAVALGLVARLATSLMEAPHSALLISVAPDSRSRTRIAAYRFGFSTLGILILSFLVGLVVDRTPSETAEGAILLFGALCALIGAASVLTSWWSVRHFDRPAPSTAPLGPSSTPLATAFRQLWNKDYALIFLVIALTPLSSQVFLKSLAFEAVYVLHDPSLVQTLLTAMMLGQIVGVPLWARAAGWEKSRAASLAFVIMAFGFGVFYILAPKSMPMGVLAISIVGVGASGALSLIWSMAADCCDLIYSRTGHRQDGAAFGALSFGAKLGSGLGALALGSALTWIDYAPGMAAGPDATALIHGFNGLAPAAVAIVCALVLIAYNLSHARHRDLSI